MGWDGGVGGCALKDMASIFRETINVETVTYLRLGFDKYAPTLRLIVVIWVFVRNLYWSHLLPFWTTGLPDGVHSNRP